MENKNNNNNKPEAAFSRGNKTLTIPMSLFQKNRQKIAERMYQNVLHSKTPAQPHIAVFEGGASETRHDTDHEPVFRQESFFHYVFGAEEPDCFGIVDFTTGKAESILFVPRLPESYEVWMGKIQPLSYFEERYAIKCMYVDELAGYLEGQKPELLYTLKGMNTDSNNWAQPAKFEGIEKFQVNEEALFWEIVECRVIKTPEEIEVLRYANQISSEAHMEVMKRVWSGIYEYQIEALFRFYCYFSGGCRHAAYTCICGSGENGAILHYGHAAEPNKKQVNQNDMVLLDMGSEYNCYGADITRSYPVSGVFDQRQREIYTVVYEAQNAVINACKPGAFYPDLHLLAHKVTCEKLKEFGFLKGEVSEMMENHIGAIFMPHGLGHMVGIDTHDVGGFVKGTGKRKDHPSLSALRLGRKLEAGMCITIEPGCYFNPATLEKAFKDPVKSKFLNIEKIKQYLDFGGVRIEDDFVITKDGCENMTTAPRSIEEIEKFMKNNRVEQPIFN